MEKNEFDIELRSILRDAEEQVSPSVWEGVAAGLARRRRIVLLRRWAGAGAVAAAAAVALFVLLRPAAPEAGFNVPSYTEDNTQSIFMSEAPGETPASEEEVPAALRVMPQRIAKVNPPSPEAVPEAQEVVPAASEETPSVPVVKESEPVKESAATETKPSFDDQALLNRLAFAEESVRRSSGGSGFSLQAFGTVQTNHRSAIGGAAPRRWGVPSLNEGVGVFNESPEVSFGLPFSVGAGLRYNFTPALGAGIGLRYTNLQRSFVGDYHGEGFRIVQTDIDNQQHWLGVPVNIYYSFVNSGRFRVHAVAGGAAEWLLGNNFRIHNSPSDINWSTQGSRPQFSVSVGVGLEYMISPLVGIYLDPGFRYYFATQYQPRSIRTIQPLRFEMEAGLRFNLGKK